MTPYALTHLDGFTLSDDAARLDVAAVHAFLTTSYWSPGVARAAVERAATHSLPLGLYAPEAEGGAQIGYIRAVTDRTTYGYLCDAYVLDAWRGRGLGRWLVAGMLAHPELQTLRRWLLATQDAHGLYAQLGFVPLPDPSWIMQRP